MLPYGVTVIFHMEMRLINYKTLFPFNILTVYYVDIVIGQPIYLLWLIFLIAPFLHCLWLINRWVELQLKDNDRMEDSAHNKMYVIYNSAI